MFGLRKTNYNAFVLAVVVCVCSAPTVNAVEDTESDADEVERFNEQ